MKPIFSSEKSGKHPSSESVFSRLIYRKMSFEKRRMKVMRKPLKEEIITMRVLILLGLTSLCFFLIWFFNPEHQGVSWMYWLLTFAMLYKILRWLHEWYHYYNVSYPKRVKPRQKKTWTVDMFTTFCAGEPYDMVVDTLKGMVAVKYPHTNYLCDEANDPFLKEICQELGVIHVTRAEKIDAKAGNINNALKQAKGEIVVILDPDHKPIPEFLDIVLPYFTDEKVGFVQVVQSYGNQEESFVARGAAEQTYQFYGPLMMGMNGYGTAQAIGANCTFRRAALDSIGGHAAGLSEDLHTAMQIHAKKWVSIYVPEVLTIGLAPSSMSAFYHQQLKWSRGTFELLITSYLKLFSSFSWRQKLHYFTIPMHFLSGLITFIDIAIPILALLLAQSVWKIDLADFLYMFIPVFFIAILIRFYAQKWLPLKQERGVHVAGGILQMGTWWIYLTGLICTLLRIKIPYIPTPKNDEPRNDFILSLPNFIAGGISIVAIPFGLHLDWSPFSLFMAGFAAINAVFLIFVSLMAQQKILRKLESIMKRPKSMKKTINTVSAYIGKIYESTLNFFINWAIYPGILVFVLGFGYQINHLMIDPSYHLHKIKPPLEKDCGGFYSGIYIPDIEKRGSFDKLNDIEKSINSPFDIVSIYMAWGPESGAVFPDSLMKEITKRNSIPMITWEPWTWPFPEYKNHPDLCCEKKVLQYITKGYFDKYLTEYALKFKAVNGPVMIRFAHEFDNPAYPWSTAGGNSAEDFIASWRYIVNHFDSLGAGNVVWVWNPWEEDGLENYYPGDEYVDWIGVTCLNYGKAASNNKWLNLDALYGPFSEKIKKYHKPVLLSEFGSTTFGGNQSEWLSTAFEQIENMFPEIKALIFFYSDNDPNWGFTSWRPDDGSQAINWTFTSDKTMQMVKENLHKPYFNSHPLQQKDIRRNEPDKIMLDKKYIAGGPGDFSIIIDNKPFYIKGIVYNGGSDWRDGEIALNREKLELDFTKIKEMGANTIRRYDPCIYDQNILKVAAEKDLKVLYGFWFEQNVDYSKDEKIMKEYEEKVIEAVKKYKDEPAILGWSIGNEVWGLSKQYFAQPYLGLVRKKYLEFLEHLAREIHEIDPDHPVFVAEEHTAKLPATIEAYNRYAPSIDVIGINSYYFKHISKLPGVMSSFGSNKPYLISEFGPEGYWQADFTKTDQYGAVLEDEGLRKAHLYERRWLDQIIPYKGSNIGGIAYCWTDRLEGTATWFGLTDNKDRLKPAYCTLKKLWADRSCTNPLKEAYIFSPEDAVEPGKEYTFYAVTEIKDFQNLTFEWYLCKDEFVVMKRKVLTEDNGRKAKVVVPDDPSAYRLYVNISNKEGFCNTASFPIPAHRKSIEK